MRCELVPVSLAVAISLAGMVSRSADAADVVPASPASESAASAWPVNPTLLAVGAGAVVGAVAFNILAAPLGTVPLAGGVLDVVPNSVALGSRLIAVTAVGAGAIGANFLYDQWTGQHSDYRYLLTIGAGALAGVALSNYFGAGMLGTPPYYSGAGITGMASGLASSASQAASRVYVVGSAVLGAWAADYLYRH